MTQETNDVVGLIATLRHNAKCLDQDPEFAEPCDEAADALQSQSARIAELEARQHGGEHGAAGDAIDFACDHCGPDEALAFLEDWRFGQTSEWPAYLKWLAVQRAGAAEASLTKDSTSG